MIHIGQGILVRQLQQHVHGLYLVNKENSPEGDLIVNHVEILDGVSMEPPPRSLFDLCELESLDSDYGYNSQHASFLARHYNSQAIPGLLGRFVEAYGIGEAVIRALAQEQSELPGGHGIIGAR